jgi:dihydrofolate synthase/folylpolyglutamate synthase
MDYKQSLSYLYELGHEMLAAKFGLDNIKLLLERLGNPERAYKSVIVAGTNGKGSVAAMVDSIARAAGVHSALYTSPHLVRIEERIRVGDRLISPDVFARVASTVREASEALVAEGRLSAPPTFFEQVTAIAMLWFQERGVELAILEVGLGGRLDATNIVEPAVAAITSIDYDHQQYLGDTIVEIAAEKAAVIKPGSRAVIGRQAHNDATEMLMRRCIETGALPVFANEPQSVTASDLGRMTFDYESSKSHYSRIILGLRGRHQADNAAAAIETAELLSDVGFEITREAIIKGLRGVSWPGRLELLEGRPAMLLDGAHNLAGALSLRHYLDEFWKGEVTLIFGAMGDKDIEGMATHLFDRAKTVVLTSVNDRRAARGPRLGKSALGGFGNVIFTETVKQAVSWARSVTPPDGLICVAGSLHLVGAVKQVIEEEDQQPAI